MANISHFTQTVNGVSTTYDIHDANAVPRSGGAVMTGTSLAKTTNDSYATYCGGNNFGNGAFIRVHGKDFTDLPWAGTVLIRTQNNLNTFFDLVLKPNGTLDWGGDIVISKNSPSIKRHVDNDFIGICGGTDWGYGGYIGASGKDRTGGGEPAGCVYFNPCDGTNRHWMHLQANGTLTWDGSAIQYVSDQRLKQQITEIDDKLLDAWEGVDLVQFKYNDAVDQKKDKARLHTGYVVQQIDKACKEHGVDISQYGLYCHEEYPEETEEVEVEQADGTKTKEKKVIREASEHYSLRYTEVYAIECMYLRRCIERLTARIEQLEKGNNIK